MRIIRVDPTKEKGWYTGPWDSEFPISIGYACKGFMGTVNISDVTTGNHAPAGTDEPHLHTRITEIYLIGRGSAQVRVEHQTVGLTAGDMLVVEPGEAHTFLSSSSDYLHFVIHTPGLAGDQARSEKRLVSPERLGL